MPILGGDVKRDWEGSSEFFLRETLTDREGGRKMGEQTRWNLSAVILLAAAVISWAAVGYAAPAQPQARFYAPFEDSTDAAQSGGNPKALEAQDIKFVPGLKGQAAQVGPAGRLFYECPGNLLEERGSVEFWFRPNWNREDSEWRLLFAQDREGKEAAYLRMIIYGTEIRWESRDPKDRFMTAWVDWHKGEWVQVVGTWDCDQGLWLYVNGMPIVNRRSGVAGNFYQFPVRPHKRFFIGGGYGQPADATYDELRIYDRPLTRSEVRQHYLAIMPVSVRSSQTIFWQDEEATVKVLFRNDAGTTQQGQPALSGELAGRLGAPARVVTLKPHSTTELEFAVKPEKLGKFPLHCTWTPVNGPSYTKIISLYSLPSPKRDFPKELRLRQVVDIDCTKDLGADQYCDDGTAQVVTGPAGRYREAGGERWSRFAYRFQVAKAHVPHILRITYPDDKERTMTVDMSWKPVEDFRSAGYDVDTGIMCGGEVPLTNQMQQLENVFWPLNEDGMLLFNTWEKGLPAAAARIQVYEVEGGLPKTDIIEPGEGPGRMVGLEWEDPSITNDWGATAPYGTSGVPVEGMHDTLVNMMDYLNFTGQNVVLYPVTFYGGPFYPDSGTDGGLEYRRRVHSDSWFEHMLRVAEARGVKVFAVINFWEYVPEQALEANIDLESIIAGADTINQVCSDNKVRFHTRGDPHGFGPCFDPIHPQAQQAFLNRIDDLLERYAQYPALQGISVHFIDSTSLWFGSLKQGYSDFDIGLFEKETKTKVPVDKKDRGRFQKYHDWLITHEKEKWASWRCRKVADLIKQMAARTQAHRPDLRFCITCWQYYREQAKFQSYRDFLREGGFDPDLLKGVPGLVISKAFFPSDFRWGVPGRGRSPETMLLESNQFDPPTLDLLFNPGHNAVYFHNRYFEATVWQGQSLPGLWWKGPFIANSTSHAGRNFLRYYAHSLATYDVMWIGNGGSAPPTQGFNDQVREWAKAFRALPAQPFTDVKGNFEPLVTRELQTKNRYYFYVVNREAYPVSLELEFSGGKAPQVIDCSTGLPVNLEQGKLKLTVLPFQLRSFVATGQGAKVAKGEAAVSRKVAGKIAQDHEQRETPLRNLREEYEEQVAALAKVRQEMEEKLPKGNFIANSGLEQGEVGKPPPKWSCNTPKEHPERLVTDDTQARSGRKSLKMICSPGTTVEASVGVPVIPGDQYLVSGWYKASKPDFPVWLTVDQGGFGGRHHYQVYHTTVGTRWEPFEYTIYVPGPDHPNFRVERNRISIRLRHGDKADGTLWWDDLVFVRLG